MSPVRLTDLEKNGLVSACVDLLPASGWSLWLFGSRTDPMLRGGDIDLLLLTESAAVKQTVLSQKTSLLIRMKENIGDQRIDFVVESSDLASGNAFVASLLSHAVALHDFESIAVSVKP